MTFESDYYESPAFWGDGMVEDAANLRRLEATCELVPRDVRNLVDVGCGNGVFARLIKQRRPEIHVTCVDRSATALEYVQADEKRRCELVTLPFEARSFDCVTCLQVIEHLTVPDFRKALAELTRVARKVVIIGVPYKEAIEKNVDTCPKCFTVFNRDLHLRSFDDATFSDLLLDFGFRMEARAVPVVDTHYLGFRTYYALQRMLRGGGSERFMSPICPLCGYVPPPRAPGAGPARSSGSPPSGQAGNGRGLKEVVKRWWPKQRIPGYWILGRYCRLDG